MRATPPWLVEQIEVDQLFAVWRVAPQALADSIPAPLSLDTFDGYGWIALIAFGVERLSVRGLPPVPGLRGFGEVDCLTCVRHGDERGVWFFRIDASTRLGAALGRLFALPYRHASVDLSAAGDWHRIRSESEGSLGRAELRARYRPSGDAREARPDSLEHFFDAPLVMYSRTRAGVLLRGVQHRGPRRIQPCDLTVERNTLFEAAGLPVSGSAHGAWYSRWTAVRSSLPVPVTLGSARRLGAPVSQAR